METTLENLQTRVQDLEQEIVALRQLITGQPVEEAPGARSQRILDVGRREKSRQKAAVSEAFEKMGIDQPPVPPEQLRQMMAANGVKPEDNLFSHGIKEMREE